MRKIERLRKNASNYMFDHPLIQEILTDTRMLFASVLTAALYAFGFCAFITPADSSGLTVVTGGVGGISQNIILIMKMCGVQNDVYTLQSILYFALNIPVIIFGFFFVGKKFTIMTAINVGLSSVFITLFDKSGLTAQIATNEFIRTSAISRVFFAGVFIGIASAIAYKAEISCGGIDVFSYYFALRKSTSVGKYTIALNSFIIALYCILLISSDPAHWDNAFVGLIHSFVYMIAVIFVVDAINVRNKKIQIQIITNREDMSNILIANLPHGTTVCKGKGGYTGADRYVVYMVVSSIESSKVVKLAKRVDEHCFVSIIPLTQVYGNFFIKPVE